VSVVEVLSLRFVRVQMCFFQSYGAIMDADVGWKSVLFPELSATVEALDNSLIISILQPFGWWIGMLYHFHPKLG